MLYIVLPKVEYLRRRFKQGWVEFIRMRYTYQKGESSKRIEYLIHRKPMANRSQGYQLFEKVLSGASLSSNGYTHYG